MHALCRHAISAGAWQPHLQCQRARAKLSDRREAALQPPIAIKHRSSTPLLGAWGRHLCIGQDARQRRRPDAERIQRGGKDGSTVLTDLQAQTGSEFCLQRGRCSKRAAAALGLVQRDCGKRSFVVSGRVLCRENELVGSVVLCAGALEVSEADG